MKFVIATKNQHKVEEFKRILSPLGIETLSQADVGVDIDVIEDADTFEGNARLKAKALFDAVGLPTIADDSGIEVDALDKAPGIFSARYGGESCKNDIERYELLLKNIENVPDESRTGRFVCSIYLVLDDVNEYSFTGICEGTIGHFPQGKDGFGYDPIFLVDGKSFAEINGTEKDEISHRGIALRKLEKFLREKEII